MTTAPMLTAYEWLEVSIALTNAEKCGCAATPRESGKSLSHRIGQMIGRSHLAGPADPRLEAIRQFVCASHRQRAPASDLAPALTAQGFNRAQIDAIALLSI